MPPACWRRPPKRNPATTINHAPPRQFRFTANRGYAVEPVYDLMLKYAISEDGRLHGEKYFHTVREEYQTIRPAFRWRQVVGLARVTASAYGYNRDDKHGFGPPATKTPALLGVEAWRQLAVEAYQLLLLWQAVSPGRDVVVDRPRPVCFMARQNSVGCQAATSATKGKYEAAVNERPRPVRCALPCAARQSGHLAPVPKHRAAAQRRSTRRAAILNEGDGCCRGSNRPLRLTGCGNMIRGLERSVRICRDDAPRTSERASSPRRAPWAPGRGSRTWPRSVPGLGQTSGKVNRCHRRLVALRPASLAVRSGKSARAAAAGDFFVNDTPKSD